MKLYRNHRCSSKHRTVRTFIKCAIRRLEWVHGRGDIAVIAWCRYPTVALFQAEEDAERAKRQIDDTACGGCCRRQHEIVRIDLEHQHEWTP